MRTCLVLLCFVDVETTKKVSCLEWKVVEILGVGFHELVCQMKKHSETVFVFL